MIQRPTLKPGYPHRCPRVEPGSDDCRSCHSASLASSSIHLEDRRIRGGTEDPYVSKDMENTRKTHGKYGKHDVVPGKHGKHGAVCFLLMVDLHKIRSKKGRIDKTDGKEHE